MRYCRTLQLFETAPRAECTDLVGVSVTSNDVAQIGNDGERISLIGSIKEALSYEWTLANHRSECLLCDEWVGHLGELQALEDTARFKDAVGFREDAINMRAVAYAKGNSVKIERAGLNVVQGFRIAHFKRNLRSWVRVADLRSDLTRTEVLPAYRYGTWSLQSAFDLLGASQH